MAKTSKKKLPPGIFQVKDTRTGKTLAGYYYRLPAPTLPDGTKGPRPTQKWGGDTPEAAILARAAALARQGREEDSGVRDVPMTVYLDAIYKPELDALVAAGKMREKHARISFAQIQRCAGRDPQTAPIDTRTKQPDLARAKIVGGLRNPPMHAVTQDDAAKYVAALHTQGCGPATVRRHVAALSRFWQSAMKGRVPAARVNPWRGLGEDVLGTAPAPTIRFRPAAEVSAIVARCPEQIRPLLEFIAESGARYEEVAGMRWSEVSHDFAVVTIPGTRSKTRKLRVIKAEGRAREILRERHAASTLSLRDGDGFVFALKPATEKRPAEPYSHGYAYKILQAALKEARIPWERPFHTLRNSLASRMVLAGVPLSVVAEVLGDSLATTSKRYAHLVPDDAVARAYQAIARAKKRAAKATGGA